MVEQWKLQQVIWKLEKQATGDVACCEGPHKIGGDISVEQLNDDATYFDGVIVESMANSLRSDVARTEKWTFLVMRLNEEKMDETLIVNDTGDENTEVDLAAK